MSGRRRGILTAVAAVLAAAALVVAGMAVFSGHHRYTRVRTSRFLEYGLRPPYADSTGSGTGVVLRDGRAFGIRWSRPDANRGTTFTTASGQPMTFARGPVWIVLAARP